MWFYLIWLVASQYFLRWVGNLDLWHQLFIFSKYFLLVSIHQNVRVGVGDNIIYDHLSFLSGMWHTFTLSKLIITSTYLLKFLTKNVMWNIFRKSSVISVYLVYISRYCEEIYIYRYREKVHSCRVHSCRVNNFSHIAQPYAVPPYKMKVGKLPAVQLLSFCFFLSTDRDHR